MMTVLGVNMTALKHYRYAAVVLMLLITLNELVDLRLTHGDK